jgi:hypothetical protein
MSSFELEESSSIGKSYLVNHTALCIDVGAMIEQSVDQSDVVVTCSPVQLRLRMSLT